jgi:TetR/AcrR family fatty acid metabolism transcriptional regulator
MKNSSIPKDQLIIRSAIKVFAERGYYKSRISDIVQEANIAHGLFYHYFPSKEDILVTIFQKAWNNLIRYVDHLDDNTDDPLGKLKSVIGYILRSFQQSPDLLKVLIMDVPSIGKFYNDENQRIYHLFFKRVTTIIEEGQRRGLIRKEISPVIASYIIHGSVDSIIRQYVYNPEFDIGKSTVDDMVDKIFMTLKRGFSENHVE